MPQHKFRHARALRAAGESAPAQQPRHTQLPSQCCGAAGLLQGTLHPRELSVYGVTLPCCCRRCPFLLQVAEAIASAVERGLTIPIIYNTSSYDALSSLALMDGLVDIVGPPPCPHTQAVVTCRTSDCYALHQCSC
jgi:hypothetical protein